MFSKQFFALTTLLLPALAAPSPLITVSKASRPVPGRYIVTLKEGVSCSDHVGSIQGLINSLTSKVTHQYSIINGYAGKFSAGDLNELRANPDVASIEEDGISRAFDIVTQYVHLSL